MKAKGEYSQYILYTVLQEVKLQPGFCARLKFWD